MFLMTTLPDLPVDAASAMGCLFAWELMWGEVCRHLSESGQARLPFFMMMSFKTRCRVFFS